MERIDLVREADGALVEDAVVSAVAYIVVQTKRDSKEQDSCIRQRRTNIGGKLSVLSSSFCTHLQTREIMRETVREYS